MQLTSPLFLFPRLLTQFGEHRHLQHRHCHQQHQRELVYDPLHSRRRNHRRWHRYRSYRSCRCQQAGPPMPLFFALRFIVLLSRFAANVSTFVNKGFLFFLSLLFLYFLSTLLNACFFLFASGGERKASNTAPNANKAPIPIKPNPVAHRKEDETQIIDAQGDVESSSRSVNDFGTAVVAVAVAVATRNRNAAERHATDKAKAPATRPE
mmetsp:Transcript_22456/g.41147  ORF Transcript_22456/g.41147 Transcript_22456/m.41147 type:complete len:209 (+) Transcript_22456:699-1325(+)